MNMGTRRWNGLIVGILAVVMMQLSPSIDTSQVAEPWPALLAGEPAGSDPGFTLLQQRANGSLERLVQAAPPAVQPL
jgi:hypothetical protein